MLSPSDVVITGVGVVSPIGTGRERFCASVQARHCGVIPYRVPGMAEFVPQFYAPITDFDGKQHIHPRKAIKVMSRELQTAFAAAMIAAKEAGIAPGTAQGNALGMSDLQRIEPDRMGTVFGSEMLYGDLEEYEDSVRRSLPDRTQNASSSSAAGSSLPGEGIDLSKWGSDAMRRMNPLWMLKYLPNMAACHVGIALDARGPNNTVTCEEMGGLSAMIEAACVIRRGAADVMVAGSTGNRVNPTRIAYSRRERSASGNDPASVIRPFDRDRTGTVEGEGAGVVILERAEHALARGARPLARLAGWGSSCAPPVVQTAGMPYGVSRVAIANALSIALSRAQLEANMLDHINAHGSGSPIEDQEEAAAIARVAGNVPVLAPKSYFGSLGAGTAIVELAMSLFVGDFGEVPPTLSYSTPDPNCPVNVIRGSGKPIATPYFAKLSHTGFGQACSVVIERL